MGIVMPLIVHQDSQKDSLLGFLTEICLKLKNKPMINIVKGKGKTFSKNIMNRSKIMVVLNRPKINTVNKLHRKSLQLWISIITINLLIRKFLKLARAKEMLEELQE
jgi:hypothetical protein